MSPGKHRKNPSGSPSLSELLPWSVIYYLTTSGSAPALDFLFGCSPTIRAQFVAVLDTVAAAPPPQFSGGGFWEAMHGDMGGWYEIRVTGPRREQFRLFCLLENGSTDQLAKCGLTRPAIAVITGMRKPWRTTFSNREYEHVRHLGDEHRQNFPRKLAQ
jgi:hypothetical protein